MARPKGSKNKAKPGKPLKPAKAAAPGIGHNAPVGTEAFQVDCFNAYREKLKPLEARLVTVKKQIDDVYLDAKKDKFAKKLFTIAKNLTGSRKQEEKVITGVKDVRFVALALGLPIAAQLDMFADVADDIGATKQSPEAEGAQAFRDGAPAKPRYTPGTEHYDAWMKGFYAEQDEKVKQFKPLEGDKPKRGRPAKAAPAAADDDDANWPDDAEHDPARPLQ